MLHVRIVGYVLLGFGPSAWAGLPATQYGFVLSYQGPLSKGTLLDAAELRLRLEPETPAGTQRVSLELSTAVSAAAEAIYPARLCYRSQVEADGGTRWARWWSLVGGRQGQGEIRFDRETRVALRVQGQRKLPKGGGPLPSVLGDLVPQPGETLDEERSQTPFPGSDWPMDRLALLPWLRGRTLEAGLEWRPRVLNGRHLVGYRIRVEGEETLEWGEASRPAWRLQLEPQVDGGPEERPLTLWLSQDPEHLPLRVRGRGMLGGFEARLTAVGPPPLGLCPPDGAGP